LKFTLSYFDFNM